MGSMLVLLLILIGIVFLGLAAFGVAVPRFHFGWGGLAILAIALLLVPRL